MNMTYRLLSFFLLMITLNTPVSTQCPGALSCENAFVLCSESQIDGFICTTPDIDNITFPTPDLCRGVGVAHNISWWAFVGSGEPVSVNITFDIRDCELGQGLQGGIFEGSCDGSLVWDCNASCNTSDFTLSGITTKGTPYFLWIDGCNRDICPFAIEFSGNLDSVYLPDSIPDFEVTGKFGSCSTVEVCTPSLGDYKPSVQWYLNDSLISSELCTEIVIRDHLNEGDTADICMVLTIGNPNDPDAICDQDTICRSFVVTDSSRTETGLCDLICYENQPYLWGGKIITSSCINPPCTAQFAGVDGVCIDSVKPIILLPPSDTGRLDTFICEFGAPYIDENNQVYTGELCEELITFKREITHPECPGTRVRCDTSYLLSIGRFDYSSDWELSCAPCSGKITLCPNIEYRTSCPIFNDEVSITLEWHNRNGEFLGETAGNGCLEVEGPGLYCVNITGTYHDQGCIVDIPECFQVPVDILPDQPVIQGDKYICNARYGSYEIDPESAICEYLWTIPDSQGTVMTPNSIDSNRITVDWSNKSEDESQVCLTVKGDCGTSDTCFTVLFDGVETLDTLTLVRCPGDTILLEEPLPTVSREWSTGDTTASLAVIFAGQYCITGLPEDSSCVFEKCFEVVNSELVISDTIITGDSGNGDGSISVRIRTNDIVSVIAWSNGETTLSIRDLEAGTYDLILLTRSGCIYTFRFVVPLTTSTNTVDEDKRIVLYPNPGASFRIDPASLELIESVTVFSVDGRLVISREPPREAYNLSAVPDGLYLVKIELKDGRKKVLKWTKTD